MSRPDHPLQRALWLHRASGRASLDDVMVSEDLQGLQTLSTWMAAFGAPHAKRTELTCSEKELLLPLHRTISAQQKASLRGDVTTIEEIVVTKEGRVLRKITGQKEVLRGTQVYPKGYGRQVHKSWSRWRTKCKLLADGESSDSDYEAHTVDWPDAELATVLAEFKHLTRCPRVW